METVPPLVGLDWVIIVVFFAVTLGIGLYFSKRAQGSLTEYFVAGRKMTWWLAGTSIVATSFAADTPLVIAGWMRTVGLERNWFWWGGIMGMMLCTFFFARLWRRSKLITDVEFNELRYGGKPAAGLRIFHASYRSLIQNTLVMGWVTLAMTKIIDVTLNIPTLVFLKGSILPKVVAKGMDIGTAVDLATIAQWPIIGEAIMPAKATGIVVCLAVAAFYSAISGLWGVMATDLFQFIFAMTGTVILMVVVFVVAGGPDNLVAKAHEAVTSGIVMNRLPADRQRFPREKLPPPLRSEPGNAQLLATGICEAEMGDVPAIRWTATGLSESALRSLLHEGGVPGVHTLMELWRESYTISKAGFTSSGSPDEIVAAGILIDDTVAGGNKYDYYRIPDVGLGDDDLLDRLGAANIHDKSEMMAAWRRDRVVSRAKITNFLPPFDLKGGGLLAVWSLVVFLGLQWWAGGEGGGFLAQRLFSCKDEKHSVLAMLWFNLANFALRPWPWIVVGVASIFLIPDVSAYAAHYDQEHAYAIMLMKYLPVGLKGLMVAALMAAYMSTISTHVNFGASYVVNDLYMRFINKNGSESQNVMVSKVTSVFLAILAGLYAYFADTIASGWFLMFELMSGVGFVVLLRWYWWRISAWSELAAMASSLILYYLMNETQAFHAIFAVVGAPLYLLDEYAVRFTLNLLCTTVIWVTVTFVTPPEKEENLIRFYNRVRPAGLWSDIAVKAGNPNHLTVGWLEWGCWFLGVTGLFAMIACLGKACFGLFLQSFGFAIYAAIATILLFRLISRMDWSEIEFPGEEGAQSAQ